MSPTQPSPGSTLALVCALGLLSLLGGCAAPVAGGGSGSSASASFASALAGTERHDGLLPVHVSMPAPPFSRSIPPRPRRRSSPSLPRIVSSP